MNHQSQYEAMAVASKLAPLVKAGCSSSMEPFLCSVLAPPCKGTLKLILPCKGLCKSAIKSCKDLLKKLDIMSDQAMRCKHFPKEGVSNCFNGSWPEVKNTPRPGAINLVSGVFVSLDQRLKNERLWEQPFWDNKGNVRILPIRFYCAVCIYAHSWNGYSQSLSLVFPPLVKGNGDSVNEIEMRSE